MKFADIAKLIGQKWQALTDKEKVPYNEMSE
jgi:hypothetical protein